MLAHVDERVGAELFAQPEIEGEIAVRRDEVGVVVARLRVDVVAARRLDADRDVAEAMRGKDEARRRRRRDRRPARPSGIESPSAQFRASG